MVVVRFRADCAVDIDRFEALLMRSVPDANVNERDLEPMHESPLDVHAEAEWEVEGVDLKTMVEVAAAIPDCRCIAETMQPLDRYTGTRNPHRPELAKRPANPVRREQLAH